MVDVGIANCDSFDSETADVKVCEGSDGERRILSRISLAAAPDWFSLWTGVVVVVVAAAGTDWNRTSCCRPPPVGGPFVLDDDIGQRDPR